MLSFLTQCPHCLTSFRVTDRQLDAAEGLVRCGACLGIFSAEANRITVKPTPEELAAAGAREDEFDEDGDEAEMPEEFDEPKAVDEGRERDGAHEFDAGNPDGGTELSGYDELDDEVEHDDSDDQLDESGDADELDLTDDERDEDEVAIAPSVAQADDTDDEDLLGPGDFDIQLGDLNLDLEDDDDADDIDADEPGAARRLEVRHAAPLSDDGELEDEYDEEDEEDTLASFTDAGEPPEDDEHDDEHAEEERQETPESTRLIDLVYEEYADEEDAEPAQADEPEPSEEFEPEFTFDDDELPATRVTSFTEVEVVIEEDDEEDEENAPDEYDDAYDLAHTSRDEHDDAEDEDLAEDDDDAAIVVPPRVPPRTFGTPRSAEKAQLHGYLADIEDDDALDPLEDDDALDAFDEPVLLETAPRRSRFVGFVLVLASFALVLLLAWQYADANIERLSRSARFAPLMPYACRVLDCPAPQRAQPDLFVSEQLLVRSHPRYAQALEVNIVFRNDATQAQPFPALELGFHDTSNRMVANRLFQPSEYLPPELQTSEMPAQSSFQVTLELVDPGSDAVNYTLDFRAP